MCRLSFFIHRGIMKVILSLLDSEHMEIVITVLHTLSKILCSSNMKSSWINFLELILLKIIDCYKSHKDVSSIFFLIAMSFDS